MDRLFTLEPLSTVDNEIDLPARETPLEPRLDVALDERAPNAAEHIVRTAREPLPNGTTVRECPRSLRRLLTVEAPDTEERRAHIELVICPDPRQKALIDDDPPHRLKRHTRNRAHRFTVRADHELELGNRDLPTERLRQLAQAVHREIRPCCGSFHSEESWLVEGLEGLLGEGVGE